MNPKDTRSRWLAGLVVIFALGLGIAIYQIEIKGSPNKASTPEPIGREFHDNAANSLDPPPAVEASASANINLLNHRRQPGPAEQVMSNALSGNEPARAAAEMPPVAATPGSPSHFGDSPAQNVATDNDNKAPPGVPISAAHLGRNSEALRANATPAASALRH